MSNLHHIAADDDVAINLDGLRFTLLALLPKDGTPRTVAYLAGATGAQPCEVIDALLDHYMAGALEYDVLADAYRMNRREGACA